MIKIGIIGGSGLNNADVIEDAYESLRVEPGTDLEVDTRYGRPSSALRTIKLNGRQVFLLARHGREHTIPPSQVNFRANIQALKDRGCDFVLATTACGSLRREIGRGDLVILDQFIDFTKQRTMTFFDRFEPHEPMHTPMADPFSEYLRQRLIESCRKLGLAHHERGTVATIEGPRFSTRAESIMFRSLGADVINMSVATEAALAAEAGLPYAAVAMSTDYDCWKTDEPPVTWEEVLRIFSDNAQK
ncbi:MAG: MTAP family purine nucleoside phosphorylase, partial [Desulfovibrionaceae bacterium]|nr:MTAP family purine nucleoside phosphorylase [Desulfovibrionaceae bacterium]